MFRSFRRLLRLVAVLAGLLLAVTLAAAPAAAAYPTSPNAVIYGDQSAYQGNAVFYRGEFDLYSANGRDHLGFGMSGNFAGYDSAGVMWFQSGTASRGAELRLQTDGNVVVYDSGNPPGTYLNQRPLWASGTYESTTYGTVNYHLYRVTMGGDGHFSVWHKLVLDTTGRWTWVRWASFGNGA